MSEQELRDEFGKRMDSYVKPVEMELSRIVLASAEDAHKVKNMLDAGADFIKTLQKFTIKNDDLIIDGSLGVVPLTMFGSMSHQLKDLQPGQTSQPVMYREGEYHIYKCDARIEARPLLYIEAKDMIYETVFKQKMERLRAETIQMVRARHNAFINEEALKNLSIQL